MSKNRLVCIDPETATDAQKSVITRVTEERGRIPTPFNIWLHNPHLAEGMNIIGSHIDRTSALSKAESEIAILSAAVFWAAPYVIANHSRHALKAGLSKDIVNAILEKRRPVGIEGRLRTICDAVSDLLNGGQMDSVRFARYDEVLGRAVIAELLVTIGYFTSISLAMNLHAMEPKY